MQGGLSQAKALLTRTHGELLDRLDNAEKGAGGIENWSLRLLIMELDVDDGSSKKLRKAEAAWELNQRLAWAGYLKHERWLIDDACFFKPWGVSHANGYANGGNEVLANGVVNGVTCGHLLSRKNYCAQIQEIPF